MSNLYLMKHIGGKMETIQDKQIQELKIDMSPEEFLKKLGIEVDGRILVIDASKLSYNDEVTVKVKTEEVDRLKQIVHSKTVEPEDFKE